MNGRMASACCLALLLGQWRLGAQASWVPVDWIDAAGRRHVIEYDRNALRGVATVLVVSVRRDREAAMRQEQTILPGDHPWTRQEMELDCAAENWRVARWEARDETGRLLASGGGEGWQPIRAQGYPRALAWRLCPWP